MWSNPATITALIIAITGLLGAAAGFITAMRAHNAINNEVKPKAKETADQTETNRQDIVEVKSEVETLKNGNGTGPNPALHG